MNLKQIPYFKSLKLTDNDGRLIPGSEQLGVHIAEAMQSLVRQSTNVEQQSNSNANGNPVPPPNVQGLNVIAQNGHYHAAILDQSEGLRRGVNYGIEYASSPQFTDAIPVHLGPNRNWDKFLGDATLHFRAFSYYDASNPSDHVYHGSAATPIPVQGGGDIPGAPALASEGSGTSPRGVTGTGPGSIALRQIALGSDWTKQSPQGSRGGFVGAGTPAGSGASDPSGGGGGGGGGLSITEAQIASCEWLSSVTGTDTITAVTATPYTALVAGFLVRMIPANTNGGAVTLSVNSITAGAVTKNGSTALVAGDLQAGREYLLGWDGTRWQILGVTGAISSTVLASSAAGVPIAASLTSAKIWIGSAGNLPVEQSVHADFTIAADGTGTLATVNASLANPYGDGTTVGQFVVNAKGQITAATNIPITGSQGDFTAVGDSIISTAGKGLRVKGGTNARIGTGTLVAGTLLINNSSISANTRVFLTNQNGGVVANIGTLYLSAQVNGVSFTVSSSNVLDTSTFAFLLVESI